jgi:hypothetical protein
VAAKGRLVQTKNVVTLETHAGVVIRGRKTGCLQWTARKVVWRGERSVIRTPTKGMVINRQT